jgi:hypothetical protein
LETPEYANYIKLKEIRGKYLNKRCFIICNGPSLRLEDIELIKNEYTFGMNDIYWMYNNTDWRPDFYCFADMLFDVDGIPIQQKRLRSIYEQLRNDTNKTKITFIGQNKFQNRIIGDFKEKHIIIIPEFHYNLRFMRPKLPHYSFDVSNKVEAFGTTAYFVFQIAVYMGFRNIIFLGADADYSGTKTHFYDQSIFDMLKREYVTNNIKNAESGIYKGFLAIGYYSKRIPGLKVRNASRYTNLDMIERVDLEEII